MNASEHNLLAKADQMTESTLIRLEDWELAHLRVAMLRRVEQTLNETLSDSSDAPGDPSLMELVWGSHRTENLR